MAVSVLLFRVSVLFKVHGVLYGNEAKFYLSLEAPFPIPIGPIFLAKLDR
jgi:hypothetical protein